MKEAGEPLTPQELEIMKVVWQLGSATVRDVYEDLLERRRIAYTSVMTMMNVLERKGRLRRAPEDGGRAYRYTPTAPRQRVLGSMVKEFVDRVFNGSAAPLLQHLVEDEQLTESDLREIRRLLKRRKTPPAAAAAGSGGQT